MFVPKTRMSLSSHTGGKLHYMRVAVFCLFAFQNTKPEAMI